MLELFTGSKPMPNNEVKMVGLFPRLIKTFDDPIYCVELGANNGSHTRLLCEALSATGRRWHYLAVEADPRHTVEAPANVVVVKAAVGAKNGVATLHLASGQFTGSSSIRQPTARTKQLWPRLEYNTRVEVPTVTLDYLCEQHSFPWIDFLWCDIEGSEIDAVLGGRRMFPRTKWFFTEYYKVEVYAGQADLRALSAALPDFDIHLNLDTDVSGDVLFVNKSVKL